MEEISKDMITLACEMLVMHKICCFVGITTLKVHSIQSRHTRQKKRDDENMISEMTR